MAERKIKTAVVLFNLGGPDGQEDVRPFLFNLFRDKAIIALPAPVRLPIAFLISTLRDKTARANYALMGGGSPLLKETQAQADALTFDLKMKPPRSGGIVRDWRVFIAMRYWKPTVADAARAVAQWGADEIVLLPLYPQYSTTTTGSSFAEWRRRWKKTGAAARTVEIADYPAAPGFVDAYAELIRRTWASAGVRAAPRLLFSAHGLPEATVARGDPYPEHVARSVAAITARLPEFPDVQICYQSRVGPMKWIGPSTEQEIERAAHDGRPILICPVAFVSEHVETLVELDIEYRALAEKLGAPAYVRVPAVGVHPDFIAALSGLTLDALKTGDAA